MTTCPPTPLPHPRLASLPSLSTARGPLSRFSRYLYNTHSYMSPAAAAVEAPAALAGGAASGACAAALQSQADDSVAIFQQNWQARTLLQPFPIPSELLRGC